MELLAAVLQDGMLCNDSNLDYDGKATYKPVGAPTEVALITGGLKAGLNVDDLKRKHPRVGSVSSQCIARAQHPFHIATLFRFPPSIL